VALSGGKDSLALLYLLKAVSGKGFPDLEIHAIHVNGEFSCGTGVNIEYFAQDLRQFKCEFCCEGIDPKSSKRWNVIAVRAKEERSFLMRQKNRGLKLSPLAIIVMIMRRPF